MKDSRRRYEMRVDAGKCVICGGQAEGMNPNDPITPCVTCRACRTKMGVQRAARRAARHGAGEAKRL